MTTPVVAPTHEGSDPQREWLARCSDHDDRPAVCSISVSSGQLEVWLEDRTMIAFNGAEIDRFQRALGEAADLAAEDVRRKRDQVR